MSVLRELTSNIGLSADARSRAAAWLAYSDPAATAQAVTVLEQMSTNENLRPAARLRAAVYMARIGSAYWASGVKRLREHLHHPEPRVRLLAAWALSTLGGPSRDLALHRLTVDSCELTARFSAMAGRLRRRIDRLDADWEMPFSD